MIFPNRAADDLKFQQVYAQISGRKYSVGFIWCVLFFVVGHVYISVELLNSLFVYVLCYFSIFYSIVFFYYVFVSIWTGSCNGKRWLGRFMSLAMTLIDQFHHQIHAWCFNSQKQRPFLFRSSWNWLRFFLVCHQNSSCNFVVFFQFFFSFKICCFFEISFFFLSNSMNELILRINTFTNDLQQKS